MEIKSEALAVAFSHHQAGRLQAAEQAYRQVLAIEPASAECHFNLGNIYYNLGRLTEATDAYRHAIGLKADFSAAYCNLGLVLEQQGQRGEAVACYRRAIEADPTNAEAHTNLGSSYKQQGNLDQAIACFRRALEIRPGLPSAHYNLSVTLHDRGDLAEAAAAYIEALHLLPQHAVGYSNLANILREQGQFADAAACYRRALEIAPELPEARWNQSLLLLLFGDFERVWPEYEWRWKTGQFPVRQFGRPMWEGQPLDGSAILLHAEQGFGDTIQFIRYAVLVKQRGGTVIVDCQPGLVKLLARCPGIDQLVGTGEELPPFDFQAPLLSLPGIFKTSVDTIPTAVSYVFADPQFVAEWREKLDSMCGYPNEATAPAPHGMSDLHCLRIGINWHGRPGKGVHQKRDIPLQCFARLAQMPGVRLVSLQKGAGREELAAGREGVSIVDLGNDVDTVNSAFMDTAAIMMNLDLVITSDTSIPHLAGALGVPVWVALPFVPDWRWLLDRTDSPWYPTMRLFRQKSPGDWAGVFAEIESALSQRLTG